MNPQQQKALMKVGAIALEIAAFPTRAADKGRGSHRGIHKDLIEELRTALDNYGVDWRQYRDEHPRQVTINARRRSAAQ